MEFELLHEAFGTYLYLLMKLYGSQAQGSLSEYLSTYLSTYLAVIHWLERPLGEE